jgi:hypothetical protein
MASNNQNIVVAGRAHIWLSPLGTAAPASSSAAMPTGWVEVGLTTEDSLQFVETPTFGQVRSHQSDYATRNYQQDESASVEVDLQEFSSANLLNVFGGGTITEITPPVPPALGEYRFAPPGVGGRSNVACIAEVIDGVKRYRYVVPNCYQDAGVTMKLQKRAEVTLPLRLSVIGADGVDAWYILSNDPSMAPAA